MIPQLERSEPYYVFGPGDALVTLLLWLLGSLCLFLFGASWCLGSTEWLFGLFGLVFIAIPFCLMFYQANEQIKHEDSLNNPKSRRRTQ